MPVLSQRLPSGLLATVASFDTELPKPRHSYVRPAFLLVRNDLDRHELARQQDGKSAELHPEDLLFLRNSLLDIADFDHSSANSCGPRDPCKHNLRN